MKNKKGMGDGNDVWQPVVVKIRKRASVAARPPGTALALSEQVPVWYSVCSKAGYRCTLRDYETTRRKMGVPAACMYAGPAGQQLAVQLQSVTLLQ